MRGYVTLLPLPAPGLAGSYFLLKGRILLVLLIGDKLKVWGFTYTAVHLAHNIKNLVIVIWDYRNKPEIKSVVTPQKHNSGLLQISLLLSIKRYHLRTLK